MLNDPMKDDVDIFLCPRRGWVIRTPMRVPDSALLRMCRYALDTYAAKLTAMPDGPAKKKLDSALRLLAMMRVTQEIRKNPGHGSQALRN